VGLPAFAAVASPPEPILREYADQFEGLLGWWQQRWSAITKAMDEAGFRWAPFRQREVARSSPTTPFEQDARIVMGALTEAVRARAGVAHRDKAARALAEIEKNLDRFAGPVCSRLLAAVRARDVGGYESARAALQALASKQSLWLRRKALLERLAAAAPAWASAIRRRDGIHGASAVPGDPREAWRWRQLTQEIERRAALDELELTRRLHQRRSELRDATAQLIDRKAWLGQLRRIDLQARQALQGWADTQRRIGKGTGKRVPELQTRARQLLAEARDAVPVWIMPLARVAESFDPRCGRFDVVIVDEASQSDVTGLLAWYLGESVAVVGDHEQVSPLGVGQEIEAIKALIAEHLGEIPNSHLYDGLTSIYDLARQCFGGSIALREHFRCVPDIIEFSNRLSYDGEIRPLRNPSSAPRPHVTEFVVDHVGVDGRRGMTNPAEARVVAALVKAVTEMPEYVGKTMGAITLLGDDQAALIQDLAVKLVGPAELARRRFAAGNSAQFQGDERHVVFLSMVDSPTGRPLPLRQTALFKQRYNVAASRARDQLWLVHSLDPRRDLQPGDLRFALIEHVRDPGSKRRAIQEAQRRAESPFEKAVMERLISAGYHVEPQVWVGHYRIDMVVSDATNQVALECDGDRFHGVDEVPLDMTRQAVLERAGWRFIRIRGTRFYRDPAGTMAWVLDELKRLGVSPGGAGTNAAAVDEQAKAFREKAVKRAWEIMREMDWLPVEIDAQAAT
jgi:very-short-patch-repair endonuclease